MQEKEKTVKENESMKETADVKENVNAEENADMKENADAKENVSAEESGNMKKSVSAKKSDGAKENGGGKKKIILIILASVAAVALLLSLTFVLLGRDTSNPADATDVTETAGTTSATEATEAAETENTTNEPEATKPTEESSTTKDANTEDSEKTTSSTERQTTEATTSTTAAGATTEATTTESEQTEAPATGKTYYIVTFKDYNGTTLKTQRVESGKAATAPAAPTRSGYAFIGWDKTFNNVTSSIVVTALYENTSTEATTATTEATTATTEATTSPTVTYVVTFKDYDGTTLKTQTVESGASATAPTSPSRTGYRFTGWDTSFDNVTSNLTVTARYEVQTYVVTFKDYNGTTLKTQTVESGSSAEAPTSPSRDRYIFVGWDKSFDNVTSNLTVTAVYEVQTYVVTFKGYDGTTLKTQTVEIGASATAPTAPQRDGYRFTGWDTSFDNVTSNLTVTAQYVEDPYPDLTFTLTSDETGYYVKARNTDISGNIVIPETYNGLPVTSLPYSAFSGCSWITGITIPGSVTSIGDYAFSQCIRLKSIVIPNGVTRIGTFTFNACVNLTSVEIPNSVTEIRGYAFYGCSKITSIVIPNGVKKLSSDAFKNCSSLTSIEIPSTVTSIGNSVFAECPSLESITVAAENRIYYSEGNCIINNTNAIIAGCKNSVIPSDSSVTMIGRYAFEDCTTLTSIVIPSNITSIAEYAFRGCTALTSITYTGTMAQWDAISKTSDWDYGTPSYTVHCTDGDISK